MIRCELDHLVITAPTLEVGARFVMRSLGVSPQVGGEHAKMGTHNLLLRIGEASYLEVISPNPTAPSPARPRWFELDGLRADSAPRLAAWVARAPDIQAAVAACPEELGGIETMSRGNLRWRITIPEDGGLPLGGVAPALIEWREENNHPARRLPDSGCALVGLSLFHSEPARVTELLGAIGFEGPVTVATSTAGQGPSLTAEFHTTGGPRVLSAGAGVETGGGTRIRTGE